LISRELILAEFSLSLCSSALFGVIGGEVELAELGGLVDWVSTEAFVFLGDC
jgi:F0F1-type ATP synthase assembly protein I